MQSGEDQNENCKVRRRTVREQVREDTEKTLQPQSRICGILALGFEVLGVGWLLCGAAVTWSRCCVRRER